MHPDEILAEILKSAGTRKSKSLAVIHATCREQFERGSKDFSIPTIARLAKPAGGPVEGSIRNKTGDDFKALISAWAKHTGGSSRKMPRAVENPMMALIQKIEAPEIRSIMAGVLAENRKLRNEVNLLKHAASKTSYIDLRESAAPDTANSLEVLPPVLGLTASEIAALRHAIGSEKLAEEGWEIDGAGNLINGNGRHIFKIGFVSALRKMIGYSETGLSKRSGNL